MIEVAKRPKDRTAWLLAREHIQKEHADLAEKILKLAEQKDRDPTPYVRLERGGQGGGGDLGAGAVFGRLSARQKWERKFALVGPAGEALVTCIVLEGKNVADTAKDLNLHPKAVLPMLRLILDVMARQ